MFDFGRLNKVQLERTADLSLEVAKTALIATILANLIPGVGEKVGVIGSVSGFLVFIACYLFAMWLLRKRR